MHTIRDRFALLTMVVTVANLGWPQNPKTLTGANQEGAGQHVREVKVTNGPVVQSLTDTTALITWSTNLSTETLLRLGTRPDRLDQVAKGHRRGLTHQIQLNYLAPDTTYYYRVGTSAVQKTEPMSGTASFKTRPAKRPI